MYLCQKIARSWGPFVVAISLSAHAADGEESPNPTEQVKQGRAAMSELTVPAIPPSPPADSSGAVDRTPGAKREDDIAAALKAVDAYFAQVEKSDAERKALSATFKFGGTSDKSDSKNQSKATIGADLTMGGYPHQVRFNVNASVQYEDGVVKEDVTTMLVNYDYYIKPSYEVYGFVERFTDSFLSIDQRYEIGLGMKGEYTWRASSYEKKGWLDDYPLLAPLSPAPQLPPALEKCHKIYSTSTCDQLRAAWDAEQKKKQAEESQEILEAVCLETMHDAVKCKALVDAELASNNRPTNLPVFNLEDCSKAYTAEGCKKFEALLSARAAAMKAVATLSSATIPDGFQEKVKELTKSVRAIEIHDILDSIRKSFTRVEVGFAFGALAEFENPASLTRDVQTLTGDRTDPASTVVSTATGQRVDPDALQRFRLSLRPSLTWRLGEYTEFTAKFYYKPAIDDPREVDGTRDYRIDAYASLAWKLAKLGSKSPKISLNFESHYDSTPPDPNSALEDNQRLDPAGPQGPAKRHRLLKLMVEVSL